MPAGARQRPIQTFAKAVAKCSAEVRPGENQSENPYLVCFRLKLTLLLTGFSVREMRDGRL